MGRGEKKKSMGPGRERVGYLYLSGPSERYIQLELDSGLMASQGLSQDTGWLCARTVFLEDADAGSCRHLLLLFLYFSWIWKQNPEFKFRRLVGWQGLPGEGIPDRMVMYTCT